METINEIPANGSLLEESTKNEKGQRGTSNECAVIFELDSEDEKQDDGPPLTWRYIVVALSCVEHLIERIDSRKTQVRCCYFGENSDFQFCIFKCQADATLRVKVVKFKQQATVSYITRASWFYDKAFDI